MKESSNIRALIVGDEPEDAEHVVSVMRTAGYTVEPIRVEDKEPLQEAVKKNDLDLALHTMTAMDVKLGDTIEAAATKDPPIPVLATGDGELTAGEALASGAADRIAPGDDDHLRHALIREFKHVQVRREAQLLRDIYEESENRARALMETSRDAIAYIHDGMHVLANDAYLKFFGYGTFEEVEGMPIMDMVTGGDKDELKKVLRASATSDDAVGTLDLEMQQANGSKAKATVEFSRASIEGEACSQIIIRAKGDTKELEKQLNMLSQRDSVTGLYNRQHFLKALTELVSKAETTDTEGACLQIVLDDFASVRSQVGVMGADTVIADVAKVLKDTVGKDNLLARLEGPAFALLCETADRDELDKLATRARDAIREHICEVESHSINTTATVGIALIDGTTGDPNDIINRTERAWAEASEKGTNSQVIYQPKQGEMSQKEMDRQWIETIRETLKSERIELLYQPIVNLEDSESERYEVILNIKDAEGNPVDVDEMLAAAERTDMSRGIDRLVLLNALKALLEQIKKSRSSTFFVPITGPALEDPALFRWLQERLKKLRLPPSALVFLIDTAAAATRIKQASAFAAAVRKIGCGIALNRFGHGNDPFQIIRHVPADVLKIHEEFTHSLASNEQNQEAIRQIAEQAKKKEIRTICPGIDDASMLSVLWGLGIDMLQGDFLQEPSAERDYDFSSMSM